MKYINIYRNGVGSKTFTSVEDARRKAGDKAIAVAVAIPDSGEPVQYVNVYRNGLGTDVFDTSAKAREHAGDKAVITALAIRAKKAKVQDVFTRDELKDMQEEFETDKDTYVSLDLDDSEDFAFIEHLIAKVVAKVKAE